MRKYFEPLKSSKMKSLYSYVMKMPSRYGLETDFGALTLMYVQADPAGNYLVKAGKR